MKATDLMIGDWVISDFGVTREQACIMCHLSSGCGGCCEKCRKEKGYCNNSAQVCSMGSREHDGQRFVAWINLVNTSLHELKKFVQKKYLK